MRLNNLILAGIILIGSLASCNSRHFITDPQERQVVEQDFANKQQLFPHIQLNSDGKLTPEEEEACKFLYAYMPIGDVTDYDLSFWLTNIRYTLRARAEMPWGKTVPEREFRHFVMPVRVNNENLDHSRQVFYEELADRVKGLSLYDAVLEVNHWCHEKAIYTPSDSRTSSPLATVKTAYGRCGEESTFLVAALRSVGIPARQVYTPRWAHTDDNHAWVEAWVDGKWYFLGACEPEPVLNLGWFNAPASRGMLMHTKVFGRYNGPEEVMSVTPCYTEINVIENYAPCTPATVTVTDKQGKAVAGAQVDFKIYNYAEYCTVASKVTDKQGQTNLTAGLGDMLVWATDGKKFGFGKLSFREGNQLTVVLDKQAGEVNEQDLDIVPPTESNKPVSVTPEQRAENTRRMAEEDSIRNAYTSTFPDAEQANTIAKALGLESKKFTPILLASRGNHEELIASFETLEQDKRNIALRLLQEVSDKDLRDIPQEVFTAHVNETPEATHPLFDRYVLNPRISNEMLCAYKAFLREELSKEVDTAAVQANPDVLTQWCNRHIALHDELNPQSIPVTPIGVWKARCADRHSRDIFYVAALRSLNIPARIDEVTGKTQYANEAGEWQDVNFTAAAPANTPQGTLTAGYQPVKALTDPVYYSHFTLSRYENGRFKLLTFPEDKSSCWSRLLKNGLPLDTGYYMLVTGTRLASGGVLSKVSFFNIEKDKNTRLELVMRENPDEVKVIGNFNSEALFTPQGKTEAQSILQTTGRGYFIVAILGARQEPTNHAIRDIAALKSDFEKWGRGMVMLFPDEKQLASFRPDEFPALPETITYGVDRDNSIRRMIMENMELKSDDLPIFIIADTFNRVVFLSQGYTIGLGEQLMKTIHKISE